MRLLLPLLLSATVLTLRMVGGQVNELTEVNTIKEPAPNVPNSIEDPAFAIGLKDDMEYLAGLRYRNWHEKLETLLVPIFANYLEADEGVIRQAVQEANAFARLTREQKLLPKMLGQSLEQFLPPGRTRYFPVIARELMEKLELQDSFRTVAKEMRGFEDEWYMDNRVAVILSEGEDADPEEFIDALDRTYKGLQRIRAPIPQSDGRLKMFKNRFDKLEPKHQKTLEMKETLQQARATIRERKFADPTAAFDDDDAWMIQLLPDLHEVRKAFQQARNELTFTLAVNEKRFFAVRNFMETGEGFIAPITAFKNFAIIAINAGDTKMLRLLLQHHAISSEFIGKVLVQIEYRPGPTKPNRKLLAQKKAIFALLNHPSADASVIVKELSEMSVDLIDVLVESGKFTKDALFDVLAKSGDYTEDELFNDTVGSGKFTEEEFDELFEKAKLDQRKALMERKKQKRPKAGIKFLRNVGRLCSAGASNVRVSRRRRGQ